MVISTLLLALILTILIEIVVLLLLGERSMVVLGSSVVINILTNIPLNIYVIYIDNSVLTVVFGELIVVVIEAFCYFLLLRHLSRAFIYSSLCNSISFLIGVLVELLIVYFQSN